MPKEMQQKQSYFQRCHRNWRHATLFIVISCLSIAMIWMQYRNEDGTKLSYSSETFSKKSSLFPHHVYNSSQRKHSRRDYNEQQKDPLSSEESSEIITDSTTRVKVKQQHNQKNTNISDECHKEFPSALIIGIQKCGTAALAEFLGIHPNIAIKRKQIDFFNMNIHLSLDWYREQMPCSLPNQLTMERTPAYFYFPLVPKQVRRLNKNARFILIVRDPVARTISNYAMAVYRNRVNSGVEFEDAVFERRHGKIVVNVSSPFIQRSLYYQHLNNWLNAFPLKQFHFVDGEKLVVDPIGELRKIESFLGLKHFISRDHMFFNRKKGFYCVRDTCLPSGKGRQPPVIRQKVRNMLTQFFKPYNEMFFELARKRFDW